MRIRAAVPDDLECILDIYTAARRFMASAGNAGQWGTTHPVRAMVEEDIALGRCFVGVDGSQLAEQPAGASAAPSHATPSPATPSSATPSHATPSPATPSSATPSSATPSSATPSHATTPHAGAEQRRPHCVFALLEGGEPTYRKIFDGAWLNDEPYLTMHRVASDGTQRGVVAACTDFCRRRASALDLHNIRIDTHEANAPMQRALGRCGFVRCRTIRLANGDPRIAYQLVV